MKAKYIRVLCLLLVLLFLFGMLYRGKFNQLKNEQFDRCATESLAIMNSNAIGDSYVNVLRNLERMNLEFIITVNGNVIIPQQGLEMASELEILVNVPGRRTFGFVVRRREKIVYKFDSEKKMVSSKCIVVLTGP